jgi:hypothetical protein
LEFAVNCIFPTKGVIMKTTLKAIRNHGPCESRWVNLLGALGKTKADDEPLSLLEILKSNGLDDALWCLRAVDGHDKEIRLYAVWCARQVQHLMKDPRSLAALDVAEAFAHGKATKKELKAAEDDARDAVWAARAAAWTAEDTAKATARTAGDAAKAAARTAARTTARDAAWTARDAAWAAGDAARVAQEKELIRICKLSEKEISHV